MAFPLVSWIPASMPVESLESFSFTTRVPRDGELSWSCERPKLDSWSDAAARLRRAGDALKALPVAEIVAAIDRVAARFCDRDWPVRREVRDTVVAATGFSREAVERSFDVELRNYRQESLWRTLRRELGDAARLDAPRFDAELGGATMALGPELALAIFTGNVPGLPALSMVRSLLVKAPLIAKVASGEPSFARSFARALHEENPVLGDSLLVTYWDRDDTATFDAIAREVELVIGYGGTAACEAIRRRLPGGVRFVEHGHKLSFGFVSAAYYSEQGARELAQAIARDVSIFNQQACIAPQTYFVEGEADATELAAALGVALAEYGRSCPVGELRSEDAARLWLERARRRFAQAADPQTPVFHDEALEYTVSVEREFSGADGIGNRCLTVVPVTSLAAALEQLAPYRGLLQNVGLGVTARELPQASALLARSGASRLAEPGRMPDPSMMWRHDGRPCVAELVRWCDVEMHRSLNEEARS